MKVKGYNIVFKGKISGQLRKFAGVTSDTFHIAATMTTSLTKDNKGTSDKEVIGFEYDFSAEGVYQLADLPGSAEDPVSTPDIVDAMLDKTVFDFVYGGEQSGDKVRKGKCIIVDYQESTTAEGEAKWNLQLKGTGELTTETLSIP